MFEVMTEHGGKLQGKEIKHGSVTHFLVLVCMENESCFNQLLCCFKC